SKYQAPYLYEEDGKFGLLYSLTHPFYGFLERVKWFSNSLEAEEFIYQIWWYQKYRNEFSVQMQLDNYEKKNPEVQFLVRDRVLSKMDMMQMLADPSEMPKEEKKQRIYQRLLRTCRLLIAIIEEKIKVQNDTYQNVSSLDLEFRRQENEFFQLYNRYKKEKHPLHTIANEPLEFVHLDESLQQLNEQVDYFAQRVSFEEIKKFIDSLWDMLFNMESEKGYLQNKYLLFKLPIDLEDVRKKKSYMEFVFNKKKGFFSRKEHVKEALLKIDSESESKKIIGMKDFIQNEIKRLKEKYSIIEEMDYATLGDYLNEFDNLGISTPFDLQEKIIEKTFTRDELLKHCRDIYDTLSYQDQEYLRVYHSFLQPLCDVMLIAILNGEKKEDLLQQMIKQNAKEIEQAISILMDPENVFLQMKKMKCLTFYNENNFLESLYTVCEKILKIQTFTFQGIGYVFGKSLKNEDYSIYHASFKNVVAPVQKKGNFDVQDILEIHGNVSLLFLPYFYEVQDVYFHDNTVEEKGNREDVLLILKNYQVNYNNSDIIKVSRFQAKETWEGSYKILHDMKCIRKESYRHIIVTK
ncbi:MAG: hypothetical protein HFI09_02265, partial [Bacilli bacterium]|nr:hypothetical protein [Bacilli bacterium]